MGSSYREAPDVEGDHCQDAMTMTEPMASPLESDEDVSNYAQI